MKTKSLNIHIKLKTIAKFKYQCDISYYNESNIIYSSCRTLVAYDFDPFTENTFEEADIFQVISKDLEGAGIQYGNDIRQWAADNNFGSKIKIFMALMFELEFDTAEGNLSTDGGEVIVNL